MSINFHQIGHYLRHAFTAKRGGHGVHSPFAYRLCEEVFYNDDSFYDFDLLRQQRDELLTLRTRLDCGNFGAGSKTFSRRRRRVKDIADRGITRTAHSEMFYKLINFSGYRTIVELGTSLGLNTLYLARAAGHEGQVISIEGSSELSDFAKQLAETNEVSTSRYICGDFDRVLPILLDELTNLDFLYVDGNHSREATLRYFDLALPKVHAPSVIVFDDIYWSKGMTEAWQTIKQHPSVRLSIDTFYFGMVFFDPALREKTNLRFFI